MSINSVFMKAKRKRRRMLLWQSNNSDFQDLLCLQHASMDPEDAEWVWCTLWESKIWAWDTSIVLPHTCKIHSMSSFLLQCPKSPALSSSSLYYMQVKDLWPSPAVGWEREAAQTKPVRQPPPAHTTVTLRVGRTILSALKTGKIPGRRIFPIVKSSASPKDEVTAIKGKPILRSMKQSAPIQDAPAMLGSMTQEVCLRP